MVDLTACGHFIEDASQLWFFIALYIQEATQQYPVLEAQLQAILNVIPAYTWYSAPSGALTFVNERTASFLGLPADDPLRFGIDVGGAWDSHIPLLHPYDHSSAREVWATCLRTGLAGEARYRCRGADGAYRWFLSRAEPLRSSDGTLLHWIGVNLDIEDVMRTEETLTAVRERLALATQVATGAQLSAAIAHEIVQPLSALVANARAALHWLEGDPKEIARAASLIAIVLRDGMSIGNVVHEMRRLFKAQSLNRTIVQPNELIRQVVLVVGRDLLGKGIELSVDLDPHLPEVEIDAIQIQHLLFNLLRNASASFTSRSEVPSTVTVRSRAHNQCLVIEVEDNGACVRDIEKVFETFYDSNQDDLRMGLAISRSIALSHGGTLVAERRQPIGVRFSVTLPLRHSEDSSLEVP
jgi:signal transduction histidine kinase